MKYFLFGISLFLFLPIFSQEKHTIRGVIKDAKNGETLLGATIYLKEISNGTLTNEYGFYSITAPQKKYTLVVSYVGFEEVVKEIELNKDTTLNFELKESSTTLNEVIITAEESERINLKKPQMSVAKLKASTIKQIPAVLGEVDVLKVIQLLPGVTNNGEGSGSFHVRGGAADQNLVLLDEAIIYNTSHFFGFFSVFNNDAIKDIKLYKGDIPSKYGGRISSVLDVRQKDGNSKEFGLTGGIGLISSRLTAEAPLFNKKGSFLISGRSSYAHLFMSGIEDLEDDRISFYDLNLKANYKINDNNHIYLSGYFGRDVFNLSNVLENNYGNASGNLRWNHVLNDKVFSNLSLIYSEYDYHVSLAPLQLDWKANIENYNLKYDFDYYVNNKIKLDFGVSTIIHRLNPGIITPSSEDSFVNPVISDIKRALENGIYIGAEHKLTDNFTANYGLRFSNFMRLGGQSLNTYVNNQPVVYNEELDIYENGIVSGENYFNRSQSIKTFNNLEPRLGLSYQLNEESSVKASYTRSAQYLHLISNTTSVTPLDVWAPSGQFIKPQLSNQYAIGFYSNLKNKEYSLEVETYYKTVDNRIDYIDGSDLFITNVNNIETEILNGEARAYGVEVLVRKNKGNLKGWFSYTLSKSEQHTPGGTVGGLGINRGEWYNSSHDRTHDFSATTSYELNKRWKLGANLVYQTGRPVTYPNSQYEYEGLAIANYSNRNENRLPAYHRLDVSATYIPRKNANRRWKGEWVFGLYNLYNRSNAASISFGQNSQTGVNEATRTSIFGIVPSVTYNFKF